MQAAYSGPDPVEPIYRTGPPMMTDHQPAPGMPQTAVAPPPRAADPLPGQLVTQPELFRLLAVSKATGGRLRAAGRIGPAPVQLGGSLRYDLAEVLAWLRHRRSDGTLHDSTTWPRVWAGLQRSGK